MKKFRTIYSLLFFFAVMQVFVSCGDDEDNVDNVSTNVNSGTSDSTDIPDDEIEYEAVDLGLPSGTKWANMNVGAMNQDDGGLLFAWGEVIGYAGDDLQKTKHSFDIYTYKWWDDVSYYKKYVPYAKELSDYNINFGSIDNKTTLELADDAAYVLWGKSWRIPTINDITELRDLTTAEWIEVSGKRHGVKLTSKINDNSIFLPTTGYGKDLNYIGTMSGYYWSSSVLGWPERAVCMYFEQNGTPIRGDIFRHLGLAIRPVCNDTGKTNTYGDVISDGAENVTYCSATISGVVRLERDRYAQCGVIYGTTSDVAKLISNGKKVVGEHLSDNLYSFTVSLTELKPSTTYYYISFAGDKTEYKAKSFKTDGLSLTAVDLGLPSGTKWANMNVGAQKPEDTGLYFAWGETNGYTSDVSDKYSFDWQNYKWCNGTNKTLSKYNDNSNYGDVDKKKSLELVDDAAYVNLGNSWRMPTSDEIEELLKYTKRFYTTYNNVLGLKITSKINDKSIFIPKGGHRYNLRFTDSQTDYWSSSLATIPSKAITLKLNVYKTEYEFSGSCSSSSSYRYVGSLVRPVMRK